MRTRLDLELDIQRKITALTTRISVSPRLEEQAAFNALRIRLLNLIDRQYAAELFDHQVLSLDDLDHTHTLKEANDLIDNYLAVTDFYEANHRPFAWLIKEAAFVRTMHGGNLTGWNALMSRLVSYKNFNSTQSTTYVSSVLASVAPKQKLSDSGVWVDIPLVDEKPVAVVSSSHEENTEDQKELYRMVRR